MTARTYTYQGGRKLPLTRLTTHFVSEAPRSLLQDNEFKATESQRPFLQLVQTSVNKIDEDLRRARRLAAAYPEYINAENGSRFVVSDRVFVRFRRPADATDNAIHAFAVKYQLEVLERYSDRDLLFRAATVVDIVDLVCHLTEDESDTVEVVDHDLMIEPELTGSMPNVLFAGQQWYLMSHPPPHNPPISPAALIDCERAWATAGMGSSDVVISVVDCGFNLSDPNFADGKFAGWATLIDQRLTDCPPRDLMESRNSHGTKCATLAAASANEVGGVGVAPNCRLLPLKWDQFERPQSPNYFSTLIRIINFIRDRADVVSCSWSIGSDCAIPVLVTDALRDAASNGGLNGRGMIWCWSAGNGNHPIDHPSNTIPVPVDVTGITRKVVNTQTRFQNPFATIPGVLHIGAISSNAQRCHYSNYGPGLELVAPSSNYHTYGRQRFSDVPLMTPFLGAVSLFSGTSAAAPIVAGVAALVLSANPDLPASEVIRILRITADKDLNMAPYAKCGKPGDDPDGHWDVSPIPPFDHGRFTMHLPHGDWSAWFGFGKVNAFNAVTEALKLIPARVAVSVPTP